MKIFKRQLQKETTLEVMNALSLWLDDDTLNKVFDHLETKPQRVILNVEDDLIEDIIEAKNSVISDIVQEIIDIEE